MKKIILGSILAILLMGLGAGISSFFYQNNQVDASENIMESTAEIPLFTVMTKDKKYMKLSFSILTDSKETAEAIGKGVHQVNNFLLKEMLTATSEEIKGNKGTEYLKSRVSEHLVREFSEGKIKGVFITEKMISE